MVSSEKQKSQQPLAGRTIVITRALAQSAEFAAELEALGARVISCPTIEIVEAESYALLDEALENLYGYDWLIFTSVNGVDYFLRRLEARGHALDELDELRVCAIGEATALRLREARIHVDVVPEQFKAEGAFLAIEAYVGGRTALNHLNFLIPRAAVARDYLPKALEEAGARVDVVPAYRTVSPQTQERGRVEAMLAGGAVDCITFTSSSTVVNFAQLFDTMDLSQLLEGVAVACIGDITASTAAEYNLHTDILPNEYTIPALTRAIVDYYSSRG
ncbi:MAG: uroporphyrinogen methyltransferase / synthase [Acidobacteriota bacterium]|jgi:uroporphyrinogen III methyltransferase/synthase|nr:uroporphyrinogen methyltransferase / synthase [Acidobacteriota bacterium]